MSDPGNDPALLRALLSVLVRRAVADGLQLHVSSMDLANLIGCNLGIAVDEATRTFVLTVEREAPLIIGHA